MRPVRGRRTGHVIFIWNTRGSRPLPEMAPFCLALNRYIQVPLELTYSGGLPEEHADLAETVLRATTRPAAPRIPKKQKKSTDMGGHEAYNL